MCTNKTIVINRNKFVKIRRETQILILNHDFIQKISCYQDLLLLNKGVFLM